MTIANRLLALLAMLLAATGGSTAAQLTEEKPEDPSGELRPLTVARINFLLANMQAMPEDLLGWSKAGLVDISGRSPVNDHAEYFLPEPAKAEVRAIYAELDRRGLSSGPGLPQDLAERLENVVRPESCKLMRIRSYWYAQEDLIFHRDLVVTLMARAAENERTWAEPKLKALDDRLIAIRRNLEAEFSTCDTANPTAIPERLRGRDIWVDLQGLRTELALRMDDADRAAGRLRYSKSRGSSCPTTAVEASGPSARILQGPDASAYYPQKALDRSVTGTVRVRIVYDEGGCVVTASVDRSSGSDLLDEAAVAAAFDTAIAPALKDGAAVAGVGVIPLKFDIEIE
ncbi:MAG TPA: TonB family protein [Steroidobacteraceae bacterium]|nr:TonB family protein [Steroidobacteraceae bacterium]